jgi:hypothetical protein
MTSLDPPEPVVGSVRKTLGRRSMQRRKRVFLNCALGIVFLLENGKEERENAGTSDELQPNRSRVK